MAGSTFNLSYVLPLKWTGNTGLEGMTAYLGELTKHVEVLVVDGSPQSLFEEHRERWGRLCKHIRPHEDFKFLNGKVDGVLTGIREACSDNVIIADDDVRYNSDNLQKMEKVLAVAEVVVPQNYFDPLPWHAKWDTARTLLNRALSHDYPGTLGIHRSFLSGIGGYDGDVMFENLELIRTVKAAGGTVAHVPDLFVRRLPPTARQFFSQRVRQAYDDMAQPWRLAAFLALIPALTSRQGRLVGAGASLGSFGLAEVGRRRDAGRQVFPPECTVFAPLWMLERACCVWVALAQRMTGGCRYGDRKIPRAATPLRELRRGVHRRQIARSATAKTDGLM